MADFLMTFVGYIDENKRPENFPAAVYDRIFIRTNPDKSIVEALVDAVNNESLKYIRYQGMTVRLTAPDELIDLSKPDVEWVFVPMHMLTHIAVHEIKGPITADVAADSLGLASNPKKIVKH